MDILQEYNAPQIMVSFTRIDNLNLSNLLVNVCWDFIGVAHLSFAPG